MTKSWDKRYKTDKPHLFKVCERWVCTDTNDISYERKDKKTKLQIFADKLNNAKY